MSVSALVAASVVWMSELPARLNPVILPLMASVRREQVLFYIERILNMAGLMSIHFDVS